jgi:hypothetical protein
MAMTLLLTCDCGARFEVEDTLAGETVNCPECHQTLQAPVLQRVPRRTSMLAVLSFVLALVGAFTVVGSALAILLGLSALVVVFIRRDRLAGFGFAVAGILLGAIGIPLTLFALANSAWFGLGPWVRVHQMGAQLQTGGSLEVRRSASGFSINRPSTNWGLVQGQQLDDPGVAPLQQDCDLLLAEPRLFAFVDVRIDKTAKKKDLLFVVEDVWEQLHDRPPVNPWGGYTDPNYRPKVIFLGESGPRRQVPLPDGEMLETTGAFQCGGKRWTFLVRLYRWPGGPVFIVRGYAPTKLFAQARPELIQVMDTFTQKKG